jgi:hypothetical protein
MHPKRLRRSSPTRIGVAIRTSIAGPDLLDQIAKIGLTPLPTRPAGRITGLYDTFIRTRANRARNSIEAGPIVRVS